MPPDYLPILTLVLLAGLVGLLLLYRLRKLLGALAVSAAGGLAALGLIHITGFLTGISLPLSLFSLLVSLVLGAPGVISLLLMQLFW